MTLLSSHPHRNSAPFCAERAQDCLLAAGRSVLRRLRPADAARWMGCHADTVERMLRPEAGQALWTIQRLCDLRAAELVALGTDELGRALEITRLGRADRPDASRVTDDLRHLLAGLTSMSAEQAAALADNQVDHQELARLLAAIPTARSLLDRFEADAAARLEGHRG